MKYALVLGNVGGAYQDPAIVLGVGTSEEALTPLKDAISNSLRGNQNFAVGAVTLGMGMAGVLTPAYETINGDNVEAILVRVEETVVVGDFLTQSPDVYHKYVAA